MIKRRQFIAGLGSAAAWPVMARAQQAAVPVIGSLSPVPGRQCSSRFSALRRVLCERRYSPAMKSR